MKKKFNCIITSFLIVGLFILAYSFPLIGKDDKEIKKLDKKYQTWFQDVEYIITKAEREAFLKMNSNEMRDLFIKNFWEIRDPTQGTPKNEFRDEHYQRLEYANKFLGRETFRAGWRTDRGRTYILLGEPRDIQRFYDTGRTYPCELWFYEAGGKPGLPPFFYLIFFKRYGAGEYELYSPLQDGPHALLAGYQGDIANYQEPYEKLRDISTELARASLSYDPSDPIDYFNMRPSLGSEMLLAKINDLPNRLVNPGYVKNMLDGIPTVTVKYTYRLLDLGCITSIYKNNDGDYFLHYVIQIDPQHVNLGQYKDKIYTTLEINGEIKDTDNVSIGNIKDVYNIELSEEEFEKIKASPIAIAGKAIVLPGEYNLTLMIINKVSKEYGKIERKIIVPSKGDELRILSPMIASKKLDVQKTTESKVKPFTFERTMLLPNVKREFPPGTYLYLYFQIYIPESNISINKNLLAAKYSVLNKEKVIWEDSDLLAPYLETQADTLSLLKPIPLTFGVGNYQLKISLVEGEQEKVSADVIDFKVLSSKNVPFPALYAKNYPPDSAYHYNIQKASAYLAQGDRLEAITELKTAHRKNPDSQSTTKTLARLLLDSKQYQVVVDLLKVEIIKNPRDYEYLVFLGISNAALANYYDAVRFYERARQVQEPTAELLNALAEAYLNSGNKEKAREIFSQSLEINPDQPQLRELLKQLGV